MADLIAQGSEVSNRWRRALPQGQPIVIGRQAGHWSVAWDEHISREHIQVQWDGASLRVEQMSPARNPVFFGGQIEPRFRLTPGQHFVIGNTTFTLSAEQAQVTLDARQPNHEQVFSAAHLQRIAFRNAQQRIELLSRLPVIIHAAANDAELFVRLISLLLSGIPHADAAALVEAPPDAAAPGEVHVLSWDRRRLGGGNFHPSQRLIQQALARQESVLHLWSGPGSADEFTVADSIDWAFCTPLRARACPGWALYVAGRFGANTPDSPRSFDPADLRDDVKFAELAAATLSSLRELRRLGRQQAGLAQFFSPVVLEALGTEDPEQVLAPRESAVSVLFCDLRGFSRATERGSGDLLGLLERVSKALGVMTHQILDHGGVVGDFHGDAAMGFWGWPLSRIDAPQAAAQAALAIRSQFESAAQSPDDPLSGFRVGIGIATGRAVAGKIGTADQVKVTVFGPVVNVAARLESLTRLVHAPILVDEPTAQFLRRALPADVARIRRVAVVRPYGIDLPVEVSELLPPADQYPALQEEHLQRYERALSAFRAGRWNEAAGEFGRLPADDHARQFVAVFMAQHGQTPPDNWDGVIPLASK